MVKGPRKRTQPAPAAHSFSLRVTTDTVRRVDALVGKLAHLNVKRATVLKLAIARGLDVLEREHK